MIRFVRGAAAIVAVLAAAGAASAGDVAPTLDFHLTAATFDCTPVDPATIACTDIVADGPYIGTSNQVMVLLGGIGGTFDGAGGIQFGIEFESTGETEIWQNWNECGGMFISVPIDGPNGSWPSSGSAIQIGFGACIMPPNPAGLMGVGYLFGTLPVTTGQQSFISGPTALAVVDCDQFTIPFQETGTFNFEGTGTVACGALPTESRTWGQIKSMF